MDDDDIFWLPPPKSQVLPLFVGTRIHADVSRKWHRSVGNVGGKGPQDNQQTCLVVHPITFWIDRSCGKIEIIVFIFSLSNCNSSLFLSHRSNLKTGRMEMLGGIVCCQLMERTFGLRWAIQSPSGATNLRRAGCVKRWGCAFERVASAGGAGHMPLVSGMTSQSSGTHWCRCWSLGKGVRWIGAIKALLQPCPKHLGKRRKCRSSRASFEEIGSTRNEDWKKRIMSLF